MRTTTLCQFALFALAVALGSSACGSGDDDGNLGGGAGFGGELLGDTGGSHSSPQRGSSGLGGAGGFPEGGGGSTLLYCGDGEVRGAEECEPPGEGSCGIDCLWLEPVCGNKLRERGEDCDPPNGETCSAECQSIRIECGNAIVQAEEECDPPDNKRCDSNCSKIVCGDFEVEGREECDPPNGVSCDDECQEIPAVCGDNVIQPGEQCDPPNGKSCGDDCRGTTTVNTCPNVIVIAAPNESAIGSDTPIYVDAQVSDPDGDEVFFTWRVTSGIISDPEALSVTYSCTEVGAQTIEITVRDSYPECEVSQTIVPYCYAE